MNKLSLLALFGTSAFLGGCVDCNSKTPLGDLTNADTIQTTQTTGVPSGDTVTLSLSNFGELDADGHLPYPQGGIVLRVVGQDGTTWSDVQCDATPIGQALMASGKDLFTSGEVFTDGQQLPLSCTNDGAWAGGTLSVTAVGHNGTSSFTIELKVTGTAGGESVDIDASQAFMAHKSVVTNTCG